jgi:D-ribulokinase
MFSSSIITSKLCMSSAGWDKDFLESIGMDELIADPKTIGVNVKPPGEPVGNGLIKEAAAQLGLQPGTAV